MTTSSKHRFPEIAYARRRHWVVSTAELLALGLTKAAIRHRVRCGHLHRVHRGVYAVGRAELTREGRWRAAVLAAGPGAALCDLPAALHWELLERGDERPHVVVRGSGGRRRRPGCTVHVSPGLGARDVVEWRGVPVTTVARTLVDLARTRDEALLKAAVRGAERRRRIDVGTLRSEVAGRPHDVGAARLARLLRRYAPVGLSESDLEAAFLELCAVHGLPLPVQQVRRPGMRLDFLWPEARLVVEVDGRETHDTAIAFADDRRRDRALVAAGFTVLRFTWAEVVHEPALVAREVRAAIERLAPR